MIVLDTNVLSEPTKPRPDQALQRWMQAQDRQLLFTTTISQAELLVGVELLPSGKRRSALESATQDLFGELAGRILPFDESAAQMYSKITVMRRTTGRPISTMDAMIAAITKSRRATLATRNSEDFAGCGIAVVNPWEL